jgi:hypothetical protein
MMEREGRQTTEWRKEWDDPRIGKFKQATAAPTDSEVGTTGNTQQRWETPTERYYQRKMDRLNQGQSNNPATREYYRMKQRITGSAPQATPPRGLTSGGLSTGADRGYAQVAFNNSPSGWQPY